MSLPFFYVESIGEKEIHLDEDTSKHIIGVLRMQKGEEVLLTDGKGKKAQAQIVNDNRKKCIVEISSEQKEEKAGSEVTIAISLIKNSSRFEWFLEKATEIGVSAIIPLICNRTEKEKFRADRMKNILASAMLQSQQSWLPILYDPIDFMDAVKNAHQEQKFIAHCIQTNKKQLTSSIAAHQSSIILIGPEGDFTEKEIQLALDSNFIPVALGNTRLRTETAGIVAASLLKISSSV